MQRRDLRRLVDVEGLDLDAARMRICKVVQRGSGVALHRTHDGPPPLQKLGRHGEAKATRGSDEEDRGDNVG